MPITSRLSRRLHQTLGEEAAEDLVSWMQQVDAQRAELRELNDLNFARIEERFSRFEDRLANLATRADLAAAIGGVREDLATESGSLREALAAAIGSVRQDLATESGGVRQDLAAVRHDIAQLEARFERRFSDLIKWSFVFWVGAVGAIAMLAGALR